MTHRPSHRADMCALTRGGRVVSGAMFCTATRSADASLSTARSARVLSAGADADVVLRAG
jgi:hypothetical protein